MDKNRTNIEYGHEWVCGHCFEDKSNFMLY